MKSYVGTKTNVGPNDIFVINNGKKTLLDPKPSQKLYNHSPDGFNWGYLGSGPAQAALAILNDCLCSDAALLYYQEFKFLHVSQWGNKFCISFGEIKEFVRKQCL